MATLPTPLASRLKAAIQGAGVAITHVSIGDDANKATWTVTPANLQGAAQPTIDAFNVNDPQLLTNEIDAETDAQLRDVHDHVIVAMAEQLEAKGVAIGPARTFADAVRNRVIVLSRTPITRPKKGG